MTEHRDTYKRFPRTLEEAFPKYYPDQFAPIKRYRVQHIHPDLPPVLVCVFAVGFVIGLLVAGA